MDPQRVSGSLLPITDDDWIYGEIYPLNYDVLIEINRHEGTLVDEDSGPRTITAGKGRLWKWMVARAFQPGSTSIKP